MIEAFYFDKEARKAEASKVEELFKEKKSLWLDLTNPTKEEVSRISGIFSLHPVTSEDILETNTRVKIEEFDKYLFIILYGIFKEKNVKLREMDFVLGKDFLITSHTQPIEAFEKLKRSPARLEESFSAGLDFLMHRLIDMEVDNFVPVLELFDDIIDRLESGIIKHPDPKMLAKILDLKRRINNIKKTIIPQQEKISFLGKNKYPFISPSCQIYFKDVHDHFYRVKDLTEGYLERLGGIFEVHVSSISQSTNEVMKVLSVMTTIMLPLTVISGIYGMNFPILPGAESPLAFWAILGGMAALILVMLSFFKKKGWV